MLFIRLYLIALSIFLVLDLTWLGWLARSFYQRQLGQWMAPQVNWPAALLFYALFIGGLLYFATWPALEQGDERKALIDGALFGLVTYATYELTNLATHKSWPLAVVAVDMIWGAFLCAAVSWGSWKIESWLN